MLALGDGVCALVIGVLLYFYTRRSHVELSTLSLICRTGEAVFNGVFALGIAALVSIATFSTPASLRSSARCAGSRRRCSGY